MNARESVRGSYSMFDIVVLDSGPLGMVSHPRPATEIATWLGQLVIAGVGNRPAINSYLRRRQSEADDLRRAIEASQPSRSHLRAKLPLNMADAARKESLSRYLFWHFFRRIIQAAQQDRAKSYHVTGRRNEIRFRRPK